jgi:hypothetical protein
LDGCAQSEADVTQSLDALFRQFQSVPDSLTLDEFKLACLDSEAIRKLFCIQDQIG